MRRRVKILGVLLMMALVSSYAAALQEPVLQQADASAQLVISGQDVITASDAGGGISSRDLLVIATIGVLILVVVLVL